MRAFLIIIAILTSLTLNVSYGHEGHGFTHLVGNTGPIVGIRNYKGDLVWEFEDGHCSIVLFTHGRIHLKPLDCELTKGETMKVCFRKEETIMDKVNAAIVDAKINNRIIETIELTYHEFQAFAKLLYKLESISPTTDKITDYVWYRGIKVINTGWNHENYHNLYGGSNKMGSIPVDEEERVHWGQSPALDPENEHRKNVDAREALDKLTCCREECCEDKMQDGIQGFFHDLLSWTKEHPTSKVLEDMDEADRKCKSDYMDTLYKNVEAQKSLGKIETIDEQMIYEGDEGPVDYPQMGLDLESEYQRRVSGLTKSEEKIFMNKVCVCCRKVYIAAHDNDDDNCPVCKSFQGVGEKETV